MGDQTYAGSSTSSQDTPLPGKPSSLVQPPKKKHKTKVFRVFRSVFRSFPIITPACKIPSLPAGLHDSLRTVSGTRITGTLFGYRKGRVSLSLQENPRCLPSLVVELAMQTNVLQKEMSSGMVRIALECEKRQEKEKERTRLLEEPLWTMYCNGKKTGYGVKREAGAEDLEVMEVLKAVSMGAGVLPGNSEVEGPEAELAYMRAHFERIAGSKDSETLYMLSPEENNGPELSIFFTHGQRLVLIDRNDGVKSELKFNTKITFYILLPSWPLLPYGIGDLGEEAFRFIDWLHEAGCSVWQVLPLVHPGRKANEVGSPHAGQDANCSNTLLISLKDLVQDGLLIEEELPKPV